MENMIMEGKFLSNTGYERNIKGIIGEKIAEIFLRDSKNLEEILGIEPGHQIKIVTDSKHVNHSGIDIIACSERSLFVVEVKYGNAMLSRGQRDINYADYNITNNKDLIRSTCSEVAYGNVYKLLFRIKPMGKGIYEINICPLYGIGNCKSVQIKLTPEDVREIKKAIRKETLKLVLRKI